MKERLREAPLRKGAVNGLPTARSLWSENTQQESKQPRINILECPCTGVLAPSSAHAPGLMWVHDHPAASTKAAGVFMRRAHACI